MHFKKSFSALIGTLAIANAQVPINPPCTAQQIASNKTATCNPGPPVCTNDQIKAKKSSNCKLPLFCPSGNEIVNGQSSRVISPRAMNFLNGQLPRCNADQILCLDIKEKCTPDICPANSVSGSSCVTQKALDYALTESGKIWGGVCFKTLRTTPSKILIKGYTLPKNSNGVEIKPTVPFPTDGSVAVIDMPAPPGTLPGPGEPPGEFPVPGDPPGPIPDPGEPPGTLPVPGEPPGPILILANLLVHFLFLVNLLYLAQA
jgi:hypothetical protein